MYLALAGGLLVAYITKAGEDASFFRRSAAKITVDGEGFTEEFWDDLAEKTEGFSGRGISKLMLAVQVRASGDGSCVVWCVVWV